LQVASINDRLAGLIDRVDEQKAVRIDEVELFHGTLDPDELIGVEMGGEAMVRAGQR
jgi:hypothetical protein